MNVRNYQYLADTLEKLGFGEVLNNALQTKMKLGFPEFELKAKTNFEGADMNYTLQFGQGKSEAEGEKFYFLNKVQATLTKQNEQPLTQEFSVYKQNGYDTKEMFNLLEKRPVYKMFRKEGENIGRWVKLDFANKDERGNALTKPYYDNVTSFNLAREVGKLNLTFANQQEKEDLFRDLKKGDRVSVTMRQNGRNEKAYIAVAPQIGGLVLYNSEMKEIKRTNTHNIEMVADEKAMKSSPAMQNGQETLPEATKQLVEKGANPEVKEGMKRRVS